MARARKLFPVYGSALANRMLAAVNRGRVIDRFVRAYVTQHDRRGILGGSVRDKELSETIGREVLLAMILEVRDAVPLFFGKKNAGKLRPEEKAAMDVFLGEMEAALFRGQNWTEEDRKQFLRDLKLYADFSEGHAAPAKSSRKPSLPEEEPPFAARVALLLDPSMLEQARRAAGNFHGSIKPLTRKLLRQTLWSGR